MSIRPNLDIAILITTALIQVEPSMAVAARFDLFAPALRLRSSSALLPPTRTSVLVYSFGLAWVRHPIPYIPFLFRLYEYALIDTMIPLCSQPYLNKPIPSKPAKCYE